MPSDYETVYPTSVRYIYIKYIIMYVTILEPYSCELSGYCTEPFCMIKKKSGHFNERLV